MSDNDTAVVVVQAVMLMCVGWRASNLLQDLPWPAWVAAWVVVLIGGTAATYLLGLAFRAGPS